jgi:hypothetical protein
MLLQWGSDMAAQLKPEAAGAGTIHKPGRQSLTYARSFSDENVWPDVAFDRIETRSGPVGTAASKRSSG